MMTPERKAEQIRNCIADAFTKTGKEVPSSRKIERAGWAVDNLKRLGYRIVHESDEPESVSRETFAVGDMIIVDDQKSPYQNMRGVIVGMEWNETGPIIIRMALSSRINAEKANFRPDQVRKLREYD